jgi:hypothetical protein
VGGINAFDNISTIEKLTFTTETMSTITGTWSAASHPGGVANSGTAGYVLGGFTNSRLSSIRKITFSNDNQSTIASTLSDGRNSMGHGASNSGTAGYIAGGILTNSDVSMITKITYSNENVSNLAATLATSGNRQHAGFANSGTAGYFAGGASNSGGSPVSTIRKLTFSNDSAFSLAANINDSFRGTTAAANSGTAGYITGGVSDITGNYNSSIDKLTFSNDTRSTIAATTAPARSDIAGFAKSGTAGYFAGGQNSSAVQGLLVRLTFSNDSVSSFGVSLASVRATGVGLANSGTL